jgi:DtxR family Mn-dependent transcriptional regulator
LLLLALLVVDPGWALALFALGALLAALVVWPGRGLLARLFRVSRMTERVLLEDALKQIHQTEEAHGTPSVEGLAGALEVGRGHAVRLVERLSAQGLARAEDGRLGLTDGGRAYARRMVRTHRLLERYLADRTGVAPGDWHDQAERREHVLSEADAEALSATMGHPRFDPHGDPIPTLSGELPARVGRPLSGFAAGTALQVVHLEDEPREAFERLVALGLRPGARLRLLTVEPNQLSFRFDGQEAVLSVVIADQITAEPLPADQSLDETRHPSLADLGPGATARVVRIAAACQGLARRRLLDLGVVPGTPITAEFSSPGGDPTAYRIRGALIALRRTQARLIQVEPTPLQAVS